MPANSDIWRVVRHEDKAIETAYITRAIADFFGAVSGDRKFSIAWKEADQVQADGATAIKSRRVTFNGGLLNGVEAPFSGAFVDRLAGLASHEAGHVLIHESRGYEREDESALGHLIRNIVEDMAIDFGPMAAWNPGVGALTRELRAAMRDEQLAIALPIWKGGSPLSKTALIRLWGCGILFGYRSELAPIAGREDVTAIMDRLDIVAAMVTDSTNSIVSNVMAVRIDEACATIDRIIGDYVPPKPQEKPQEKPKPEESQEQEDSDEDSEDGSSDSESSDESGDESSDSDSEDSNGDSDGQEDEDGQEDAGTSDSDEDAEDAEDGSGNSSGDSDSEDSEDGSEDGSEDSDSDSDSDEAGTRGDKSDGSDQEDSDEDEDITDGLAVCPGDEADKASDESSEFWDGVRREAARIEQAEALRHGDRNADRMLRPWIDPRIVQEITRAYSELASEPSRSRREDTGRIDRKRIAFAGDRQDIFTLQSDRQLDGTLALLLDMSYSTHYYEKLIKRIGASVYTALRKTPIRCHVFAYGCLLKKWYPSSYFKASGEPEIMPSDRVVQLATPERVIDFGPVHSDGGTPTAEAVRGILAGVPVRGQSVLLHVTDGQPEQSEDEAALKEAKRAGWRIVTVTVGSEIRFDYGPLSDSLSHIRDYSELPEIIRGAVRDMLTKRSRSR